MNTQTIINNFQTRKRVTEQAIKDLDFIFDWITNEVDNINIYNNKSITMRATVPYDDHGYDKIGYDYEDDRSIYIIIKDGICGMYIYSPQYSCWNELSLYQIDYINFAETIESLENLFLELEKIGTRENSGNSINNIKNILCTKEVKEE